MNRSLGVVIPAYRPDIPQLSTYVRSIADELAPETVRLELDAPAPGVTAALEQLPATVNVVDRRRGKGAAISDGFERLDTDVLAFVDADGSIPVASLAAVIDPVDRQEAGLAVGSRRHPDATVRAHQTHARRWLGDAFVLVARLLLRPRLYDYQCGAKAIDRDVWADVRRHLYEPGFAWDIELIGMTAALGHHIVEVPVVWDDQPGTTVSTVETSIALARTLVTTRRRAGLLRMDPRRIGAEAGDSKRPPLIDRNDD